MTVSRLHLTNFRSYEDRQVEFDPATTLIIGPNATGKTNILEGLYVLATTKSFRARDSELIRKDAPFFRLEADVGETDIALSYKATPEGREKRVRHNDVARTLIDHLGLLTIVLFEPNDLLIIHGGPERRRRYLDIILTQTDRKFAATLSQYRRVLQQRNRLLSSQASTAELFAWNVQLSQLAADIDSARKRLADRINDIAEDRYAAIADATPLELEYQGVCDRDYASQFLQLLEHNLPRDRAAGFTTIGPHRDDFTIKFKGAPVTSIASRGEMRTIILALKLAELSYLEEQHQTKPMLLLDDVFSELDDTRRHHLLNVLGGYQSVVTTTNADVSEELGSHHATIYTSEFQRV